MLERIIFLLAMTKTRWGISRAFKENGNTIFIRSRRY